MVRPLFIFLTISSYRYLGRYLSSLSRSTDCATVPLIDLGDDGVSGMLDDDESEILDDDDCSDDDAGNSEVLDELVESIPGDLGSQAMEQVWRILEGFKAEMEMCPKV